MADLTIKGLPDEIYERLKQKAEANRRSLNQEIIYRLERQEKAKTADPDDVRARGRELQAYSDGHFLTQDELREAIQSGRT